MKIKGWGFACLLTISSVLNGQPKTFLSFETGPSYDILRVNDQGNIFKQSLAAGEVMGVSLSQDIFGRIAIGTGLYYHQNKTGINMVDKRFHQPEYKSFNAIYIPILMSFRISFLELPLSLKPWFGYQHGIVLSTEPGSGHGSQINTDSKVLISYSYADDTPVTDRIGLLEAGASLNYHTGNNWHLSLAFSHLSGLKELETATIDYQTSQGETYQSTYRNDGSRMQLLLSIQMPVSNLWEKSDFRRHNRIEQSSIRGSGIRKQNTLYFGASVASLWRTFTTTDLAIGPRQTYSPNVLNSANLYTGAFVGIMFENNVGLDVGGYYQRSGSFFTLSYTNNEEYFIQSKSPFLLDLPFHVRYFYDIRETNFTLVPSMGISVPLQLFRPKETPEGSFQHYTRSAITTETYAAFITKESLWGITADIGFGMEYKIPVNIPLNAFIQSSYNLGYRNLIETEVTTSLSDAGITSSLNYRGSGWKATFGVRMPLVIGEAARNCGAGQRKKKESTRQKEDRRN